MPPFDAWIALMLDLKPETEALALRLAEASHRSVDAVVREALEARGCTSASVTEFDTSPEAIAARVAAMDEIVAELNALPVIDPRPVQQIIDEINET